MKRFLLIFLTCVVALSLFILPASAESTYQGTIEGRYAYFTDIPAGYYSLKVYTTPDRTALLLDIPYFELRNGSYQEAFEGLTSIFDNVKLDIIYNDNLLQCALKGVADHTGDPAFDLFGSVRYPNVVADLIPVARHMTFLESVGSFFSSSVGMLADVATVVVSYPALLIMTIGVVILGYIAFQIKRMM